MTDVQVAAQLAYEAYVVSVGGKAFNGDDLPGWHALPTRIRDAWAEAANAVLGLSNV